MPVAVRGLADLNRAFAHADRDARLGMRAELRQIGQPVRREAEQLAGASIRNIGEPWSRMRVGVTRKVVYVAPRQRGNKARRGTVSEARRKADQRFAGMLMDRAMEPALQHNQARAVRETEEMLDRVCDRFNRG